MTSTSRATTPIRPRRSGEPRPTWRSSRCRPRPAPVRGRRGSPPRWERGSSSSPSPSPAGAGSAGSSRRSSWAASGGRCSPWACPRCWTTSMTTARSAPRAPSDPRPWADTDRQASRPRGSVVRAERNGRRKGHQLQDAPEHGHRARARLSSASEPWTPETAVRRSSGPCVRADLAQVPTDMRPGRGVDGRADPRLVPSSMAAAPTGMAPLELSIVCPGVAQASLNLPTPSRSIERRHARNIRVARLWNTQAGKEASCVHVT